MYLKPFIYSGILLCFFSFILAPSNGDEIWNGTGDANQSVTIKKIKKEEKSFSSMCYKFKNVRFGSIIDTGSFTITKRYDVEEFLTALKGAIDKISDSSKTEWTKEQYRITVGGSSSKIKNHFRIEIGAYFCPIHKKDAKKLIKALEIEINEFEK